jgi:hypothetical protein
VSDSGNKLIVVPLADVLMRLDEYASRIDERQFPDAVAALRRFASELDAWKQPARAEGVVRP